MENTKHYTWREARELMRKFNEEKGYTTKGNKEHLYMVAVITEDSFDKQYSLTERSYEFSNDNKAFLPNQCSNSIFADCLDERDLGVRLDWYIPKEWKVEYCYIVED
jgi:hypothetical protein